MAGLPTVKLCSIIIGDRTVRFLAIRSNGELVTQDQINIEEDAVPLFLGTDLLDCSIDPNMMKNGVRIHARYAKEGKASKLNFKDCRIEGINHSKSLWAYSIQGVFQVVFSLNSLAMQRDCLLKLKDVWVKHSESPKLEESTTVFLGNSIPSCSIKNTPSDICQKKSRGKALNRSKDTSHEGNLKEICQDSSCGVCFNKEGNLRDSMTQTDRQFKTGNDLTCRTEKHYAKTGRHLGTQTDVSYSKDWNNKISNQADGRWSEHALAKQVDADLSRESNTREGNPYSVQGRRKVIVVVGRNIEMVESQGTGRETERRKRPEGQSEEVSELGNSSTTEVIVKSSVCESCHCIQGQNKQSQQDYPVLGQSEQPQQDYIGQGQHEQTKQSCRGQGQCEQRPQSFECIVDSVVSYLQVTYSKEKDHMLEQVSLVLKVLCLEVESDNSGVDFDIFRLYVHQIERATSNEIFFDDFGIFHKRSLFVTVLCEYLGQVFRGLGDTVIEKVKRFKREHISNIGNLPPPEVITDRVFPNFMTSLIAVWMGRQTSSEAKTKLYESAFLDEHNYGYKRLKRDPMAADHVHVPNNALIQLILELTNNTLISPMAHVVVAAVK